MMGSGIASRWTNDRGMSDARALLSALAARPQQSIVIIIVRLTVGRYCD